MAVAPELRATVRAAFGGRCGYCGVPETSVGGELEIDHFHPQAAGGGSEIENLVYACTTCNRFKGDYAPAGDAPESLRLLHPSRDDVGAHITETAQGHLLGVSARGWFHIHRIHLNRPLLIEMRRLRRVAEAHREDLLQAQAAEARLRLENDTLQSEIARLRRAIVEILRRGER